MALPTKSEVSTGQYSADGSPFIQVAAKSGINVDTLEYSADGSPWWGTEDGPPPSGEIAKVAGVLIANIGKIAGIPIASIGKIAGKVP